MVLFKDPFVDHATEMYLILCLAYENLYVQYMMLFLVEFGVMNRGYMVCM